MSAYGSLGSEPKGADHIHPEFGHHPNRRRRKGEEARMLLRSHSEHENFTWMAG